MGSQLAIGFVPGEQRIDHHQDAMRARHCRPLGATPGCQTPLLGSEIRLLLAAGRRSGGLDQGRT
jgi:hypothetical protein